MIVSKNWLAEYVDVDMPVDELTDRLTMSGLNLEGVETSGDDLAIDLEVTSNRPDCLGHIGVAREVSVLFDKELRIPSPQPAVTSESAADATAVQIDCPDLCHEYHARVIRGIKVGPSPDWLKDRLAAAGINSVSNVVDITNYVMLECGQPIHAFDFDKLDGGRIVVRRAGKGEKITAIDQRDYALTEDMCVIADASRPTAIAGVMGGLATEISDGTVNVLVETASFEPLSVRATARALKLHSPSSFRFERRVNRQNIDWASRRCCELIMQVAGGELLDGSVVAGDAVATREPVSMRFSQVPRILGMDVPPDECVRILVELGLELVERTTETASFTAPAWRLDLTREADLIEEIARIYGYDRIPDDATLPVVATSRSVREQVGDAIRTALPACGFFESLTLSFISREQLELFRPRGDIANVAVNHSTRSKENQLRQSLIPSLLHCRRQNERHGTLNAELFEVAKVYLSAGEGKPEHEAEPTMLGIVSGRDFLTLKGVVEMIVARVCPQAVLTSAPCSLKEFGHGRGAALQLNGADFGWLGELDRGVIDAVDLQEGASVAEINVNMLEDAFQAERVYQPLPKFPAVTRDLNFVLGESVTWAQLEDAVTGAGGTLLQHVSFGGQYRGKGIETGHKSYLVSCVFMADDRTLTTEEVDAAVAQILAVCEEKLAAKLR
ncbi:MAG: phenylalanine--tRNA ligase subunit beta [Planctomycetaceae bacterium]|nr:phenylalanine--tRNA ligase subunit beta [Planctomycetaceae bacterium]